jgi:hypothetical protein
VLGQSRSGITTLLCELLYAKRHTSTIYCFSHFDTSAAQNLEFIKATTEKSNVRFESSLHRLGEIVQEFKAQKQLEEREKRKRRMQKFCRPHEGLLEDEDDGASSTLLLVFDAMLDASSDEQLHALTSLVHSNSVSMIFSASSLTYVPIWVRERVKYWFSLQVAPMVRRFNFAYWCQQSDGDCSLIMSRCQTNYGCAVWERNKVYWFRARQNAQATFRRFCLWPRLVCIAAALLESHVAPYVTLDIVDFLLSDLMNTAHERESTWNHFNKITAVEAVQTRLLAKNGGWVVK